MLVASILNFILCPSWAGGLRELAIAFSCLSSSKVLEASNPACNQLVACAFEVICWALTGACGAAPWNVMKHQAGMHLRFKFYPAKHAIRPSSSGGDHLIYRVAPAPKMKANTQSKMRFKMKRRETLGPKTNRK